MTKTCLVARCQTPIARLLVLCKHEQEEKRRAENWWQIEKWVGRNMNDRSQSNEFRDKRLSTIRSTLRISQHDFWSARERPKPSVMTDVSLKWATWTSSKWLAHQERVQARETCRRHKKATDERWIRFVLSALSMVRQRRWRVSERKPETSFDRSSLNHEVRWCFTRRLWGKWDLREWLRNDCRHGSWRFECFGAFFVFALWCFEIRPQLEKIFHVDKHFRVSCESDTSRLCESAMSCNWAKRRGFLYALNWLWRFFFKRKR